MTTQTEQMEAFPRTTLELLEELAKVHRAEHVKAGKALDALRDDEKIARTYEKARDRVAKARHLVAAIDQAAERERKRLTTKGPDVARSVSQEAADVVNSGALDHDGTTVTASVSPAKEQTSEEFLAACDARAQKSTPAVDPVTGEVGVEPLPGADGSTLDDPGPETPVPSATSALDPITAEGLEAITGEVRVTYPGAKEACTTDVGSRTQYAELVADYLATLPAVSPHRDDPVAYYSIMGVDDGLNRDLRSPVSPEDYGVELAVVRLADVQEANELLEDAVR